MPFGMMLDHLRMKLSFKPAEFTAFTKILKIRYQSWSSLSTFLFLNYREISPFLLLVADAKRHRNRHIYSHEPTYVINTPFSWTSTMGLKKYLYLKYFLLLLFNAWSISLGLPSIFCRAKIGHIFMIHSTGCRHSPVSCRAPLNTVKRSSLGVFKEHLLTISLCMISNRHINKLHSFFLDFRRIT